MLYASTGAGSGDNTARFLRSILAWISPDFGLATLPEINFMIRKVAHVAQFFLYALLIWRALRLPPALAVRRRVAVAWILGSSMVLALASEGIQVFVSSRTPTVQDIVLDFSGALIGVGLILLLRSPSPGADEAALSK